jgi:3-isopropylmalate/(R)-2-methylmalate dehydratase small subunit
MKHGLDVIARHCLESVRPEFAAQVQAGDVIVADQNFGIGSSREQAAGVLVQLGVAAVIAPSFSGLFFRNAFNLGLLLITCDQLDGVADGDSTELVRTSPPHVLLGSGRRLNGAPIPDFLLEMVQAGGLMNLLRQRTQTAPSN